MNLIFQVDQGASQRAMYIKLLVIIATLIKRHMSCYQ